MINNQTDGYAEIDPIISSWVQQNRLTLYTQHQDVEVRSVDCVDAMGRKVQIWIDQPVNGEISVHAWNYRKLRRTWKTTSNDLASTLKAALAVAQEWLRN